MVEASFVNTLVQLLGMLLSAWTEDDECGCGRMEQPEKISPQNWVIPGRLKKPTLHFRETPLVVIMQQTLRRFVLSNDNAAAPCSLVNRSHD